MDGATAGWKEGLHGLRQSVFGFKNDLTTSLAMWAEDFDVLGKVLVRLIDNQVTGHNEALQTAQRESRSKKLLQSQVNRISSVWEKEHLELVTLRQTVALQNKTMAQLRERIAKNDKRSNDDASPSEETPRKIKVVDELVHQEQLNVPPTAPPSARQPRRFSIGSSALTRTTEAYAAKRKHVPPAQFQSILKRPKYDDVTDENSTKQVKAAPSAVAASIPRSRDLSPDDTQVARTLYANRVVDNPDLDLDDIVLEVLESRHDRLMKADVERSDALRRFILPASSPPLLLKIKSTASLSQPKVLTPLQFATFFGEYNVAQVLLRQHPSQAEEALIDASREGYVNIVQLILTSPSLELEWSPHAIGRAFVVATTHCHLDVMAYCHASPLANLALLCKGDWCTRDQLGLRYIAAAAHAAVDQNSVQALAWLLQSNALYRFELEHAFELAMRRATTHRTNEGALAYLPLLCSFIHSHPFLASIVTRGCRDPDRAIAVRVKAIATYLIADLHTNTSR
ncbi:hypothetical protein H310_07487 [Aphanomyces invadans]|uniref:Uncharacterized protein n=1 Tax=Aphanomyces invadans TaxID=157072 RepID=A0A024U2D5_9STRA|nr:hypothetical protein H310_07487 [Aphanomyces invadans]ETW00057.1 hypothetical protein H310_07487 [Aphanomyces invadans]|eukprot:XP_008871082.1 hypothetical protein H310_07487 [Aphanomyces invadans]